MALAPAGAFDPWVVSREFALGSPIGPPHRLPGRSADPVWQLRTDRGSFVVKSTPHPTGPAAHAAMTNAARLERAAPSVGVLTAPAMPPRSDPRSDPSGPWAAIDGALVRVWARIDGRTPDLPADARLAAWLGTTVAALAALALPAVPADPAHPDPVHPDPAHPGADAGHSGRAERADAAGLGELSRAAVCRTVDRASGLEPRARRELAAAAADLAQIAASAQRARPAAVLCHRDINSRNILLTADGPVLLDFDQAGPQAPWWEMVHHGFLLSCRDLGAEEPDARAIRTMLTAYTARGGEPGPADHTAFGGLVTGLLTWLTTSIRAGDGRAVGQAATSLPFVARSVDRWAALLR